MVTACAVRPEFSRGKLAGCQVVPEVRFSSPEGDLEKLRVGYVEEGRPEYPSERHTVGRVNQKSKIVMEIEKILSLKEPDATCHCEWNRKAKQRILKIGQADTAPDQDCDVPGLTGRARSCLSKTDSFPSILQIRCAIISPSDSPPWEFQVKQQFNPARDSLGSGMQQRWDSRVPLVGETPG